MSKDPYSNSSTLKTEATRILAHQLWERAGCPHGHDLHFWHEAEQLLQESTHTKPSANGSGNGSLRRRAQPTAKKSPKSV
jgi:hypothetical protein